MKWHMVVTRVVDRLLHKRDDDYLCESMQTTPNKLLCVRQVLQHFLTLSEMHESKWAKTSLLPHGCYVDHYFA